MITVSNGAKALIWQSLQESGISTDRGLRLQPGVSGFLLVLDQPTEDDRVVYHRDAPVIILDGALEERVEDLFVDVTDGPQGTQLTIGPVRASAGKNQRGAHSC